MLVVVAAVALCLAVAACGARKEASGAAAAKPADSGESGAAAPPSATIQIDYANKGDYLRSVTVTKFSSAELIPLKSGGEKEGTSIVRFEGGVPVWQIRADESLGGELISKLPVVGGVSQLAVASVKYAELPKGFAEVVPDAGPPEPLETLSYYVFAVERAIGAPSFQAIRVGADGSITGYDAQPRAGDSYALCCNVASDFASPASP
jgi:hypothetical protein